MLKTMGAALLGVIFILVGLGLIIFYLSNLDKGSSPVFIVLALVLTAPGIFLLIKTGQSDATVWLRPKAYYASEVVEEKNPSNILDQNNQLSEDWEKVTTQRDKLKTLEASAAIEDKNS